MKDIFLHNDDCLKIMDILISKGVKVDAIITDPPYGKTQAKWDNIIPMKEMWEKINKIKRNKNTPIILFGDEPFSSKIRLSNEKEYKYDWKWEKTQATGHFMAKKRPLKAHEDIMVFYEKQCLYKPQKTTGHKPTNSFKKTIETQNKTELYGNCKKEINGGGNTDRNPRSVYLCKSDKQKINLHSTQKPIKLMDMLVKTYSKEGDTVLDFTAGSMSTGIACIMNNRKFIGIEINKECFEKGKKRIENYLKTGDAL